MTKQFYIFLTTLFALSSSVMAQSRQYPSDAPRPVPRTRPELKQYIEDVKFRSPRIPLPELSEADREVLGDRADNYESRLRYHYLGSTPERRAFSGRRGQQESAMTLDYGFKVELFWLVSRTNNCQYCLGHQESKLLAAGRDEDRIAALDCDWDVFSPAERAAFAFARKYTYEPHLISDKDIDALRAHFTDMQILEMLLSMSWNNSINRWKEGVGVPQNPDEGGYSRLVGEQATAPTGRPEEHQPSGTYLTPTSPQFQKTVSKVAPFVVVGASNPPASLPAMQRPPLEAPDIVLKRISQVTTRQPRLPLQDVATTRQLMELPPDRMPENWMRLMANFPEEGSRRGKTLYAVQHSDHLTPLLKSQLAWIVARQDRAWYVIAHAMQDLRSQGLSDGQIFALDGDWSEYPPAERGLFRVARNLGASPVLLTDDEVQAAVRAAGPAAVVQAVEFVSQIAALNRISEAAGLPADDL